MGSALLVASMPTFNYYANLANVDVPYTFWLTFSLWLYIQFVRTHHPRALYGFALTATLAICTKDQAYGFYAPPGRAYSVAALAHCPRTGLGARRGEIRTCGGPSACRC